jgi:hypothetical protein
MPRFVSLAVLSVLLGTISLSGQDPSVQKAIKEGKACVVIVNSSPTGASILIDGSPAIQPAAQMNGLTPAMFTLFKKDLPRVITIQKDGYKPLTRSVDPTGAPVALEVSLEPLQAASSSASTSALVPVGVTRSGSSAAVPSPFGFRYGASKSEVLKDLGPKAVVKTRASSVTLNTAPTPHPDFEFYTLFFSPQKGLLKVSAASHDVESADDGSELRATFSRLKSTLEAKYGAAKILDNCKGSEVACEPQFFMMQLMEKNRTLFALWESPAIVLEVKALGIRKGYVTLDYEFPGWDEFVDNVEQKKDSVF